MIKPYEARNLNGFFIIIILLISACQDSGIVHTPEKLSLINGEIDPCRIISLKEARSILSAKVTSEPLLADFMPSCKYISTQNEHEAYIRISVATDATMKRYTTMYPGGPSTAANFFESRKNFLSSETLYEFKQVDGVGDDAFRYGTVFLSIAILKNVIYYEFIGFEMNGVDYDTIMKIIDTALPRLP